MRARNVLNSADPGGPCIRMTWSACHRSSSPRPWSSRRADGYVRASTMDAVTLGNRAGRHRAARHGRRWADPAGRRQSLVPAKKPSSDIDDRSANCRRDRSAVDHRSRARNGVRLADGTVSGPRYNGRKTIAPRRRRSEGFNRKVKQNRTGQITHRREVETCPNRRTRRRTRSRWSPGTRSPNPRRPWTKSQHLLLLQTMPSGLLLEAIVTHRECQLGMLQKLLTLKVPLRPTMLVLRKTPFRRRKCHRDCGGRGIWILTR
jgi:hypothetical protein